MMRTTLNLDDDVAAALSAEAARAGTSLSRVANALVRDGLLSRRVVRELEPYEAEVFDSGAPRLDVTDVSAALEILDEHDAR